MPVAALYATVVLIWGTTWFAIEFQLGTVAEELSVAYRFAIASACLFAYARATGRDLAVPPRDYGLIVVMGALMFSISYVLVYIGTGYITSGLVAVLYSLIVIFNGGLERVFYGTPVDRRLVAASFVGLSGTALVFWPEVATLDLADRTVLGIAWTVASVFVAALGNMAAIGNTRRGMPIVVVNAHAMAWGAGASLLIAMVLDRPISFSLAPGYVASLAFLAIFGSSIAFGCFLALIKQVGSARASYASVLFPIVALLVSTLFEGYRWTPEAIGGVGLILTGNWLALTRMPTRQHNTNKQQIKQGDQQ